MLSVLIPVFNTAVDTLIDSLESQLEYITHEILVLDDGSSAEWETKLQAVCRSHQVKLIRKEQNAGRSAARNRLAHSANYDHLLFLDADVEISPGLIKNYLPFLDKNKVVFGGVSLSQSKPEQSEYYFRWYYGLKREMVSARQRSLAPYKYFKSCNFLISRDTFLKHPFDETINTYGHGDTALAINLEMAGIEVIHIDNPVIHHPYDTLEEYLQKTLSASKNLGKLLREHGSEKFRGNKLIKVYSYLQKAGLASLAAKLIFFINPFLIKQISKQEPSLAWFDLYKLGQFIRVMNGRS